MMIIGVDYHPGFQQIAFLVEETGECGERRLNHSDGEAEKFYRDLKARGTSVRVGMETTGFSRWFERLLAELGFEVWIGDAAEIKTRRAKKQKTDRQDAQLLLKLLLEDRFPRTTVIDPAGSVYMLSGVEAIVMFLSSAGVLQYCTRATDPTNEWLRCLASSMTT